MTVLTPCRRCHRRADCEIRTNTLLALRGLKLTKASLKCAIPAADFPPGTVVDVKAFEVDYDGDMCAIVRRAVVRGWKSGKAAVILEPGEEIGKPDGGMIAYLKVESDRLTGIDEPIRPLCKCGLTVTRCRSDQLPLMKDGKWFCVERAREDNPL